MNNEINSSKESQLSLIDMQCQSSCQQRGKISFRSETCVAGLLKHYDDRVDLVLLLAEA